MKSLANKMSGWMAAVVLAALISVPAFAQDPSANSPQNEESQTTGETSSGQQDQSSQDNRQSSEQDSTTPQSTPSQGDTTATEETNATGDQPASDQNTGSQSDATQAGTTGNQGSQGPAMTISAGEETDVKGFVAGRQGDQVTIVTSDGQRVNVMINAQTEIKEKKSNPFRGAKRYSSENLLPGLRVEVEGRGDNSGNLVAEKIKFKNDDFETAYSIETRVDPVERELAETRENAQRMSGQLDELGRVSNAARGGAVAAQETADRAVNAAGAAQGRADEAMTGVGAANERIGSLDNYDIRQTVTVNFKVNSAVLSKEAQDNLDEIASHINNEKGYIIEVTGFASADGSTEYNRRLSQRRADAVVRYLAEKHNVPLRRVVVPFGYGELQPVADNTTREGRQQNRRVEVRIMVNRGITGTSAEATTGNQMGTSGTMSNEGTEGTGSMESNTNTGTTSSDSTTPTTGKSGTSGNTGTTGTPGKTRTE